MNDEETEIAEAIKRLDKIFLSISFAIIGFIFGVITGVKYNSTSPPVEEIVKADSIIKVNDSIKIVVSNLDSIKNAKIVEVQTLDDDSTVKLFYKLINK